MGLGSQVEGSGKTERDHDPFHSHNMVRGGVEPVLAFEAIEQHVAGNAFVKLHVLQAVIDD